MTKLQSIKETLAKILANFERISTDKGILEYSDEEIAVGTEVKVVDEEGNTSDAEDGEYTTSEGIVYVVKEGKVSEIREPENENEGEEAPAEEEAFSLIHRMAQKFDESYADKERRIMEAIRQVEQDAWLVDAGDDFAVAEVWNEEEATSKFFRWALTWDEEGNPILGERIEVKDAFVPVDENTEEEIEKTDEEKEGEEEMAEEEEAPAEEEDKDEKIKNLEAEIARLEEENGELKERIKELEDEPSTEPAEEQFEKMSKAGKTGNEKLDRACGIFSARR